MTFQKRIHCRSLNLLPLARPVRNSQNGMAKTPLATWPHVSQRAMAGGRQKRVEKFENQYAHRHFLPRMFPALRGIH